MKNHIKFHEPSFSVKNRLARLLWSIVWLMFFRLSFRTMHKWRSFILKTFKAKLGNNCKIYNSVDIWAPWNLVCKSNVVVGPDVEIYNPSKIIIGNYVTISQNSYLCGASHDYNCINFPLISKEIVIEDFVWIAAKSVIMHGLTIGEGAVLGICSVATKNLEPWTVYAGVPAKKIKDRNRDVFILT